MKRLASLALGFICTTALAHCWEIGPINGDCPSPPRIPTPDQVLGDPLKILVNPASYINTTGVPTAGDFVEEVIRHPDQAIQLVSNPGQWPYVPVANAMISGRNAVVAGGGRPLPPDVRAFLLRWYPADMLDSIRYTTNWGLVQNTLQAAQLHFNDDTQAITLINAIVFKNSAVLSDFSLWAHEAYHVQQYRQWGVYGFAKTWVDNSSPSGPVEGPAYRRQDEARLVREAQSVPVAANPGGGGIEPELMAGNNFPGGWAVSNCGCWGPPAAFAQAPMCISGRAFARACPGACGMGGPSPWQRVCSN